MLVSTLLLFSPQVKAPTNSTHSQILIIGNSGFTSSNGVTGGTGAASDPYLIQGWNISVCWQCPYYGIEVANTTAYFRIFSVTVSSEITGQPATDILLKNVTNGRIDNSVVQDGSIDCCGGIIVTGSTNIVVNANSAEAGTCNNPNSCSGYDTIGAYGSTNVTISGNTIQADTSGNTLGVKGSSKINISNNTILMNGLAPIGAPWSPSNGIVLSSSENVQISQNNIRDDACSPYSPAESIIVRGSTSVQIVGNNVTSPYSCGSGIVIHSTSGSLVYHNNLVSNTVQASDDNPGKNLWDNGYPSGGNYWSDYNGVDRCGGPQQNICPFRDGIGDTPYSFNDARDRFPLIAPFHPTSPALASHGSITINGDSGFLTSNGVTGGNGTDADPYKISSWNIAGNPNFESITISNTRAFFSVDDTYLSGAGGGIRLNNVTNGRVEDSQSYQYQGDGIYVNSSRNVILAFDSSLNGCGSPNECTGGDGIHVEYSSNIAIAGNSLSGTTGDNLRISNSNNVSITGNSIGGAAEYGMWIGGSTNVALSGNSFSNSGLAFGGFGPGLTYTVTPDNTVNGKPLYYFNGCNNGLTLDNVPVGQLFIANCSNVQLSNLDIEHTEVGITMVSVQHALIENVTSDYDHYNGIVVGSSSDVRIVNGDFSNNGPSPFIGGVQYAAIISGSNNTLVSGTRFWGQTFGLLVAGSANSTIGGNIFTSTIGLLCLYGSTGVRIFHNSFYIAGIYNCFSDNQPGHSWDNGYPSGGNYYSNYTGTDPDNDGLGDTPYSIPGGVYKDNYPLMKPFIALPIVSVVVGTDGNLYSSFSRPDGSWNPWQSLSGSTPSTPVTCRAGANRVELVVRGMDNVIYHKSFVNGIWSTSWDSLGGLTPDQPACAVLNGSLYVVVRGMTDELYYQSVSLGSDAKSGWISLSGASPSPPSLCVSWAALELVVRGEDNGIYHKTFSGSSWSLSWDKNPNGVTIDSPSCSAEYPLLYVVVRGATQGLWATSFNLISLTWASSWTDLQGSSPSTPALVNSPYFNRFDLVVRGMNNAIYHKSLSFNGAWSSTWDTFSGITLYAPSATSDGSNVRLVVVATDGSLVSNMLPIGSTPWAGWTSMNGSTSTNPSVT